MSNTEIGGNKIGDDLGERTAKRRAAIRQKLGEQQSAGLTPEEAVEIAAHIPAPDEAALRECLESLSDEQLRVVTGAMEAAYRAGGASTKSKPDSGMAGAALEDAWRAVELAHRANLKNNADLHWEAEERLNAAFAELEAEMSSTEADKAFIRGTDKDEDFDDDEIDFDDDDDDDEELD
jgi:hypothetical protein